MNINIELRLNRWHDQAMKENMPFTFRPVSHNTVEISLSGLPDKLPEGVGVCLSSRLPTITAFRLLQLERLGVRFGVFRPAETFAKHQLAIFQAYDLPQSV